MERTRNSRVNPMTLKCDLDFESVQLSLVDRRHTERKIWVKFNEKRSNVGEIWSVHKLKGKSHDLEV